MFLGLMNVPYGAVSSVVEHYNDTVGVTGSIPVLPTILFRFNFFEFTTPAGKLQSDSAKE